VFFFVFGFEAWDLEIPEVLHGCRARWLGGDLARDRYLGQGILCGEEPGLRKNLSWITRGLRVRFSAG